MKNIGIVCEGPTDYILLRGVIDEITGQKNYYVMLQPEPDLRGKYGNGWKGVWKWCHDNADIRKKLMRSVQPVLDILVIQMDGDVSRKEKAVHCLCSSTYCEYQNIRNPLECDVIKEISGNCPVRLPCRDHAASAAGYISHLKGLLASWLKDMEDICVAVPCDSTEAWVIAAYDETDHAEEVEDPWKNVISRGKSYHGIRIHGHKKILRIFEQFTSDVRSKWATVTELCQSAKEFEHSLLALIDRQEP